MNTNSFFDISRFNNMLVRQLAVNYKTLLIGAGAIIGFLLFVGTMTIVFGHGAFSHKWVLGLVMPFFFVGGYIFSSAIFSELNSPNRGYLYLTLPASAFEKLVSAWLVCSVMYVLLGSILLYVINIFYITVATTFTSNTVELVNIFSPGVLKMFGVYLVTQSVFFLGAIYFRKVNFLKTILALFVLVFVILMYMGLLSKAVPPPPDFKLQFKFHFGNYSGRMNNISNHTYEIKSIYENIIVPASKILFWGCMAPFFLTVSYFRLKEREV